MSCLSCASNDQEEFSAEMIIHFSVLKSERAWRLGILKVTCLYEFRIFAFQTSGAEFAPFADRSP
jgi:hypothetical protein